MNPVQLLARLDTVLGHWADIRVRLGDMDPMLAQALDAMALKLGRAQTPEAITVALDRLLELVEDTPADAYVRELMARATLGDLVRTRGMRTLGTPLEQHAETAAATTMATHSAGELASAASGETVAVQRTVYLATNRAHSGDGDHLDAYSAVHSKTLSFARATVSVPMSRHKLGKLEQPTWWNSPDAAQHFLVAPELEPIAQPVAFCTRLGADAAPTGELLAFLHGYHVTLEEALLRAAQVALDIGHTGPVLLFSWPSAGALRKYAADEERAASAAKPFAELLGLLEGGPWKRVHLLAHSMGNRVLVGALAARAARVGPAAGALPLANVILAAADVYVGSFDDDYALCAPGRADARAPVPLWTSYASRHDRALWLSKWLHDGARVGSFDGDAPYTADGLQTIDASSTDASLIGLNHSYFGGRPSVLTDIAYLMQHGLPAGQRPPLEPVQRWWRFKA